MSNKVNVNFRGQQRTVYLENNLGGGKYSARMYTNDSTPRRKTTRPRRTVRGLFQVYSNGSKRFLPRGENAGLLN